MAELAKTDLGLNPSLQQWACKHQQRPWVLEWYTHALWFDSWPYPRIDPCLLCPPQSASVPQIPRLCDTAGLSRTKRCTVLFPGERLQLSTHKPLSHPQSSLYLLCIYSITYTASGSPNSFIQPDHYLNHLLYTFQVLASCMAGHQCHTWAFQWLCT